MLRKGKLKTTHLNRFRKKGLGGKLRDLVNMPGVSMLLRTVAIGKTVLPLVFEVSSEPWEKNLRELGSTSRQRNDAAGSEGWPDVTQPEYQTHSAMPTSCLSCTSSVGFNHPPKLRRDFVLFICSPVGRRMLWCSVADADWKRCTRGGEKGRGGEQGLEWETDNAARR